MPCPHDLQALFKPYAERVLFPVGMIDFPAFIAGGAIDMEVELKAAGAIDVQRVEDMLFWAVGKRLASYCALWYTVKESIVHLLPLGEVEAGGGRLHLMDPGDDHHPGHDEKPEAYETIATRYHTHAPPACSSMLVVVLPGAHLMVLALALLHTACHRLPGS